MSYTILDFQRQFSDDDTCLAYLFEQRFGTEFACPKCERVGTYYRVAKRRCYSCSWCANQIHPTAGTIFHKSRTSLTIWFLAIYYMSQGKNGVSAMELQRHIGVTYKTAFRMMHQIRKLMASSPSMLGGTVEVDETYIGGKAKGKRGRGAAKKTPVFGAVQRGGEVRAVAVSNVRASTVMPLIRENVRIGTTVMSDELASYNTSTKHGYKHERVKHSAGEYVRGNTHTNTIEGFWSQLKRSVDGTYHSVSPKHLQRYVDEFAFRYNHRDQVPHVFQLLVSRI